MPNSRTSLDVDGKLPLKSSFEITTPGPFPPVDLYLIYEKSIWENQVRQTGFLVYFEVDFSACVVCKKQF